MGLAEERQALLNGVLAAPDDDAPRLVFADWLEEHGEPERAEFIRVQCELARSPERSDLANRSRQLLQSAPAGTSGNARNDWEWAEEVRSCAIRWVWRRGFVEEIGLRTEAFLTGAGAIFRSSPIGTVTLLDREPGQQRTDAGASRPARADWMWIQTPVAVRLTAAVPTPLFRRLRGPIHRTPVRVYYATEAEATAALSAACVAFGREEAAGG